MTIDDRECIRKGMFLTKDCGEVIFVAKSPRADPPKSSLSDIAERLERVRKKLAVLRQVIGQRQ